MKREELPDTFYCTGMLLPPLYIVTTPACALQDSRSFYTVILTYQVSAAVLLPPNQA